MGEGMAVGAVLGFLLRDLLPVETASAWVPFAVLGAGVWPFGLRRGFVALTLAVALVWVLVAFGPVGAWLPPRLVRREPPRSADAVFVLASRIQSDGQPTAAAQSRLLHGVELAAQGWAPALVLTELPAPAAAHAPLASGLLARLGHEHVEIVSVGPVRSTREEALQVAALCRQRGWGHVLVVTTPLHSRRACGALEGEGLEVTCSPATETEFDVETLDRPVERLVAFRQALRETAALFVYRRRGWIEASGP
jgi:uncharacterized SAM-binding protein YcdF (DUF218 family)